MYLKGFIKLSLAHSPLCWQYRNHVIRLRSVSLCLGCSGFYSGFLIGFFIILIGLLKFFSWEELVILSSFLYLPTMLRLLKIKFFSTSKKYARFSMRLLLGLGIATGILSILIAPDIFFQIIQILLGLGLYFGIAIARIKDPNAWKECETCTYTRSNTCFGFRQFYIPEESNSINLITEELEIGTGSD